MAHQGTRAVAINGRFLGMPVTGVQRYAHELTRRLPGAIDRDVVVFRPDMPAVVLGPGDALPTDGSAAHGGRGHLWEQSVLPVRLRRAGRPLLFSPCNWGPLAVAEQVVMIHDVGPLLRPDLFTPSYVRWARVILRALAARAHGIVTSCDGTRRELCAHLPVDPDRVSVVPPGVASTFIDVPVRPAGGYCVFVGGQDRRKNLAFLLSFWPDAHAELGLELRVVARSGTTTRKEDELELVPGVVIVRDPSDQELAELYAGALCLLWPSLYEGYGLPLLEAMAAGTPFISTDTGAARELAVRPELVQPLEPDRWYAQLAALQTGQDETLRVACRRAGAAHTWAASVQALIRSLGDATTP